MVCFCDIPLSHAKNHMENYGYYGIGLNKDWGIKNSISPVLYAHQESEIIKNAAQISKVTKGFDKDHKDDIRVALFRIFSMIKPYEGKLRKNGRIIRFYDEREWRFVPYPWNISEKECRKYHKMKKLNDELPPLDFEPSDIR